MDNDVYAHAVRQIQQHATPELVQGFREQMMFIRERYKHNAKTVDSCLKGMGDPPTLLELLTAAFVVNGGVLFKHGVPHTDTEADSHTPLKDEEEELELSALMDEISELTKAIDLSCLVTVSSRNDITASDVALLVLATSIFSLTGHSNAEQSVSVTGCCVISSTPAIST